MQNARSALCMQRACKLWASRHLPFVQSESLHHTRVHSYWVVSVPGLRNARFDPRHYNSCCEATKERCENRPCKTFEFEQDRAQIRVNEVEVYTVPTPVMLKAPRIARAPCWADICRSLGGAPLRRSKWSNELIRVAGANQWQYRVNNPPASTCEPTGSSNTRGWRSQAVWVCPAPCRARRRALRGTTTKVRPRRAVRQPQPHSGHYGGGL